MPSFNPFSELHPGNPAIKHRPASFFDGPERRAAVETLQRRMQEISGDPSGSDPNDYLSPEDAEICRRFVALADSIGWVNADVIDMRRVDAPGAKAWSSEKSLLNRTSKRTIAKAGLTKRLFFAPAEERHKGYVFGRLSIAHPTPMVALCDDGKLRSLRGEELQKSDAIGWGALPEPELLDRVMVSGEIYGVNYTNPSSRPLNKILLGNLPSYLVRNLDLKARGLD